MSIEQRPGPAPRAARSLARKRQLAGCAAQLFLERGFAHVSVADVARAAGVTGPALYRHFPDKQALLVAAVLHGIEDLEECTDTALRENPAPGELIRVLAAVAVSRPATAVLWRTNSIFLTDEQNHQIAERIKAMLRLWSAALLGEQRRHERGSRTLAWAIMSVVGSVSVHRTRLSATRARAEVAAVIERVIALSPATAPPLSRRERGPDTSLSRRDEILDVAARLFLKRGFADVGIDDIGSAVGISGPSVYNHFDSKRAILAGIARRSGNRLEADVVMIFNSYREPLQLLSHLIDSYVRNLTEFPDLSVGFDNRGLLADDEIRGIADDLVAVQRNYVGRWIALLQDIRPGEDGKKMDSGEAALQVHAALSIANDAVRMGRNANRPDFPAELAYLMKGALGLISR